MWRGGRKAAPPAFRGVPRPCHPERSSAQRCGVEGPSRGQRGGGALALPARLRLHRAAAKKSSWLETRGGAARPLRCAGARFQPSGSGEVGQPRRPGPAGRRFRAGLHLGTRSCAPGPAGATIHSLRSQVAPPAGPCACRCLGSLRAKPPPRGLRPDGTVGSSWPQRGGVAHPPSPCLSKIRPGGKTLFSVKNLLICESRASKISPSAKGGGPPAAVAPRTARKSPRFRQPSIF